jgi:hypothetical protein
MAASMRQVQALLHTAELERFLVAHPNTFKRQKSEPSAGLKPAKRQRRQHWVCDQRHKSQVPVEVIVNLAPDGCLLKSSPMLSYHVLGWDDAMAVCAANRARGEIDLVMLPTPQLPQVTMNTLRQIQGHSAALTPYEHPVCAPTDLVEAVFPRPPANGETVVREELVLHIVNGALSGYSVNKVRVAALGLSH